MYFPFVAKAGLWDLEWTSSRRAVDGCEPAHVATAEEHGRLSSAASFPPCYQVLWVWGMCICTQISACARITSFIRPRVPSALLDAGVD
mmetsp:Transcript_5615/g.9003  ORF Transcript_5615/g.9003 Transcript_5615/m.9003 type:complete len:89 (+) Transcript_5615:387-653(+)